MSDRSIQEAIKRIAGVHKQNPVVYIDAEIVSVDLSTRTCECLATAGNVEYQLLDVKLMASIDDGLLIEPVVGSTVKVIYAQSIEPFICQYSEIENITIDAKTGIKFNDGSYEGIVKVVPLTSKISALETQINNILTVLKSTVIPLAPTGSYPFASLYAQINAITPVTVQTDLENKLIKHGK